MTCLRKFIHRVRENGTNNMANSKVLKNRVRSIITSLYFPIHGLDQRGSFISVYKIERKSIFIIKQSALRIVSQMSAQVKRKTIFIVKTVMTNN